MVNDEIGRVAGNRLCIGTFALAKVKGSRIRYRGPSWSCRGAPICGIDGNQ
jgi:hypothetical protein